MSPPESEILPSLDDSDDNFSEDMEDDEDLGKRKKLTLKLLL